MLSCRNMKESVPTKQDYQKGYLMHLIPQDISLYRDQWNEDTATNQFDIYEAVIGLSSIFE